MTSPKQEVRKGPPDEKGQRSTGDANGATLYRLLRQDHERILELFDRLDATGKENIDALLQAFTTMEEELKVHLEGEERFVYTALQGYDALSEKVLESYEEHVVAKTVIGGFNSLALDDRRWKAKLRVLRKIVELHIREEDELLKRAKDFLSMEQARTISEQLQELKRKGSDTKALGEPKSDI